jgi:hypothetical protein
VENPATAPDFLRSFLVSYQNLSNQERLEIDGEIRNIYENQADLRSPRLKFMTVAFGFVNIMGENNFKALVEQLRKYQKLPELQLPPPVGGCSAREQSSGGRSWYAAASLSAYHPGRPCGVIAAQRFRDS